MTADYTPSVESGGADAEKTGRKTMSTREKGNIDVVLILSLLHEIGYASGKQVTRAIYGKLSESTRRMANRKLSWMVERGLLLERRETITADRIVALSEAGARTLNEFVPAFAKSGKNSLRHAHDHRTRANDVYSAVVHHEIDDGGLIYWSALSEAWIQRHVESGRGFGARSAYVFEGNQTEKVADLLLNPISKGERIWIEIENNYRSNTDIRKVTEWLIQTMRKPAENQPLEVWFVVTKPGAATIKARIREALLQEQLTRTGRVDGRPVQVRNAAQQAWQKCRFYRLDGEALELMPM